LQFVWRSKSMCFHFTLKKTGYFLLTICNHNRNIEKKFLSKIIAGILASILLGKFEQLKIGVTLISTFRERWVSSTVFFVQIFIDPMMKIIKFGGKWNPKRSDSKVLKVCPVHPKIKSCNQRLRTFFDRKLFLSRFIDFATIYLLT
jgi:hypothetical protein